MRIAIITPAFNAAATLGDTLRSVLAQSYTDWRLVVVDDGSIDGTAERAAAFSDTRIQVIRQDNAGVSAARNRGLAALDGDAFLFLDADDALAPHALAALARALAADPHAVATTGAARFVLPDGKCGTRRRLGAARGELLPGLLIRNRFANCGQMLVHRAVVRSAGRFRDVLSYGEDWEYAIRIACHGPFVAAASEPLLIVRERADGGYWRRVADPAAISPCLDAIYENPLLRSRFSANRLNTLRNRAEAENAWVVGRALLRQGYFTDGRHWLLRSAAAAPSARRIALLVALCGRSVLAAVE